MEQLVVPLQRTFCPTGWIDSLELGPEVWPWDSRAVAALQGLATRGDRGGCHRHRRLWLARRPGPNRWLVNHDELAADAAREGFEVVYPEDESMDRLRASLDETAWIVAPVGAQLINLVATRPGVRVLVLAGSEMGSLRAVVAHYLRVCGHEVALVGGQTVGPTPRTPYERKQAPYEVDASLLDLARRDFFSGREMVGGPAAH